MLDDVTVIGQSVAMPALDRALYVRVDKVLKAGGGKWSRSQQAHVFSNDIDPRDVIDQILATQQITTVQDLGYFPTPPDVVTELLAIAKLTPGMTLLEPSAGTGSIATAVANLGCTVDCIELAPAHAQAIANGGYARSVTVADFLSVGPPKDDLYDAIVMNPPFARQTDLDHVRHAVDFVKPGGRVIAVVSAGVTFRTNSATREFHDIVAAGDGTITELAPNAFKASGTLVRTAVVQITRTPDLTRFPVSRPFQTKAAEPLLAQPGPPKTTNLPSPEAGMLF